MFNLFIRGLWEGMLAIVKLIIETHLVNDLKLGILISLDVIGLEGFELSFLKRQAIISSC